MAAPVSAVPVPTPPPGSERKIEREPGPVPAFSSSASVLPFDSSLLIVLDKEISSTKSSTGQVVPAHLKSALVVGGKTLATPGSGMSIKILTASGAKSGDVYGYVDILAQPLELNDGQQLPLRMLVTHLTAQTTVGHESTVGVEDTIGDIFIPGHIIYHAMRKGRNVSVPAGTEFRVRTMATVAVDKEGKIYVQAPHVSGLPAATPAADFPVYKFATAAPPRRPNQKPTVAPTDTPRPEATDTPSPTPTAS